MPAPLLPLLLLVRLLLLRLLLLLLPLCPLPSRPSLPPSPSMRPSLARTHDTTHDPAGPARPSQEESGRGSGPNAVLDYPSFARIAHRLAAARDAALAGQPRAAGY
jgi:hypothetical protein